MRGIRNILLTLLVALSALSAYAQEESMDTLVVDSISIDKVLADTICMDGEFADTLTVDSIETDSTMVWPQTLQVALDRLIERKTFLQTSQLGLMVYDLDADSVLYSHNARQTLRPASTMKLVTAITALDKLGGAYQFKTRLKYNGEITDSTRTLNGNVYIIGGMDPRIGRDDLSAFAESLKKLDIDTIRGNVCLDKSMKDSDLLGEGWCWDDNNPMLSACVFNRKDNMGEAFLKALSNCGIFFDGTVTDAHAPSSAYELCSRSHSIDQILHNMMKDSNNLYAEAMYYQIGLTQGRPSTAKKAKSVEQTLIRKLGLTPSRYRLADGSGLSLYNYLSAELEVRFLQYAFNNSNIYSHLYPSLPIAGVDGTLEKRMRGSKAVRNVRAKTGTLTGISSLAGYATASNGHRLAFCIINQGVLSSANAKNFQDDVCKLLCR